jgi:hypothetical protein
LSVARIFRNRMRLSAIHSSESCSQRARSSALAIVRARAAHCSARFR